MKVAFVAHAGNLTARKKGGQDSRRPVACTWGVADTEQVPFQPWPTCQVGRELSSLHSFTSGHGLLLEPGLSLGPEVTEQMVPNGAQDVCGVCRGRPKAQVVV